MRHIFRVRFGGVMRGNLARVLETNLERAGLNFDDIINSEKMILSVITETLTNDLSCPKPGEGLASWLNSNRVSDEYKAAVHSNMYLFYRVKNDSNRIDEGQEISSKSDLNEWLNKTTGEEFEKFVSTLLLVEGRSEVDFTKLTGDQGVDLLVTIRSKKVAVQAKRYSGPVGNSAVQEVYSGKSYYDCEEAWCITNSYFTPSAKDLASKTGVVLFDLDTVYLLFLLHGPVLKMNKSRRAEPIDEDADYES